MVTPFIVTSEEKREAALAHIERLGRFSPGTAEALERLALIEAVKAFENARATAQGDEEGPS